MLEGSEGAPKMGPSSFGSDDIIIKTRMRIQVEGRHTLCRNKAENSSNVFEKWFKGSVIPDSRNPRP